MLIFYESGVKCIQFTHSVKKSENNICNMDNAKSELESVCTLLTTSLISGSHHFECLTVATLTLFTITEYLSQIIMDMFRSS